MIRALISSLTLGLFLLLALPTTAAPGPKPIYPDTNGQGAIDLTPDDVPPVNLETASLRTLVTWLDIMT